MSWTPERLYELGYLSRDRSKTLAHKLEELENKIETHDEAIRSLVSAIRQLMAPPSTGKEKIAFQLREKRAPYGRR
jgi:hypothetical protein